MFNPFNMPNNVLHFRAHTVHLKLYRCKEFNMQMQNQQQQLHFGNDKLQSRVGRVMLLSTSKSEIAHLSCHLWKSNAVFVMLF